jgi:hypothetical protein
LSNHVFGDLGSAYLITLIKLDALVFVIKTGFAARVGIPEKRGTGVTYLAVL